MHPYLSYPDLDAALTWLRALGFEPLSEHRDADGAIRPTEVRVGGASIVVRGFDDDYEAPRLRRRSVGYGLYVVTDDVDAVYETALQAGSRPVVVPEDAPEGGRRARVLDPGGYEWTFGSARPAGSSTPAIPSR